MSAPHAALFYPLLHVSITSASRGADAYILRCHCHQVVPQFQLVVVDLKQDSRLEYQAILGVLPLSDVAAFQWI